MDNGYGFNGAYTSNGNGNGMSHGDIQQASGMMVMDQDGMLGGSGQSLDDIVNQNAKYIRRQSMPQAFGSSAQQQHPDPRRITLMDYGSGSPGGHVNNFGFDGSTPMEQQNYRSGGVTPSAANNQQQRPSSSRHGSVADQLHLETSFANNPNSYGTMLPPNAAYVQSPVHAANALDMSSLGNSYFDNSMTMNMDYGVDQNLSNPLSSDAMMGNVYNQQHYNQQQPLTPMHAHSGTSQGTSPHVGKVSESDHGGGASLQRQYSGSSGNTPSTVRQQSRPQSLHVPDLNSPAHGASPLGQPPMSAQSVMQSQQPQQQQHRQQQSHLQNPASHSQHQGSPVNFTTPPQRSGSGSAAEVPTQIPQQGFERSMGEQVVPSSGSYNPNNQGFAWETPEGGWPTTMNGRTHMSSVYKNAYSSTGFDMLGVLMRIATRPNPQINIGSVDLSCAFVVCDAEKDDIPIVYCSDNFERLTGYTKHMILGRNCRFLQSPDGNVVSGLRRKYVDDDSVVYLKNMITCRKEAQISLINYRRGGQPFMNLLTIIPIAWDGDNIKFYVGFQVDLVEQPNAVTNKNPDGSYSINYQRGMTMPRYVMNAPETGAKDNNYGQTVARDQVSDILTTISGAGESDFAKRVWDKVLLENTDDVVHVLSLKGLFQWVSPSALRVLEYEPGEIIGTALSSVCHPSDIVPVTRELKDTSTGASVNVVFRIRRKINGYMWFEGHGSLHTEQGKGRKSIIMVGRERPVYTLSKNEILAAGGIGENELWTKISTSGMFLFVSSNVRQLLDRQPDELVGVSIQSLMRIESRSEFGRILEHARTGKKASVKHEMINRRGQVLSAFTTLYPGDATEGQKPTFIVAQTRLIKFSRGNQTQRPGIYNKGERHSSESVQSNNTGLVPRDGAQTPGSAGTNARYHDTDGSAATYAGQNGLALGRQDLSLAAEDNLFDELKTTKSSSWQYEIRQLEKRNRLLAEEVQSLIAAKKKRKRRKGAGNAQKDCANCHTRVTPEWRRGPSGQRDLCNSCGLRWAKLNGKVSPRTSSQQSVSAASDKASKASASPRHMSLPPTTQKVDSGDTARATSGEGQTGTAQKPTTVDGHGASMEGAIGVPDKIEEGVEPD